MNRNIFITNIDYLVSDRPIHEIYSSTFDDTLPPVTFRADGARTVVKPPEEVRELLRSEELWSTTEDQLGNRTTYRTAIAMSEEVQKALGMYRDVYEKNMHEAERSRIERDGWSQVVNQYLKASFWQRLKWAFVGGYL